MRILFLGFSGLAVDNIAVFKDDAMLNQSLIQSYNLSTVPGNTSPYPVNSLIAARWFPGLARRHQADYGPG
jgi:hypothetical protein